MMRAMILTCCVWALTACAVVAQPVTWTGAGDGASIFDGANWSTGVMPSAGSDVIFPAGATVVDVGGLDVRSLTTARDLKVARYASFSPLPLAISNAIVLQNGVTLAVESTDLDVFTGSLTLSGTTSISGNGTLALNSNRSLMRVSGTLTVATGVTIANALGTDHETTIRLEAGAMLINRGVIRCAGGGNVIVFNSAFSFATLRNTIGSLEAISGGRIGISEMAPSTSGEHNDYVHWSSGGTFIANGGTIYARGVYSDVGVFSRSNGGTVTLGGIPTAGLTLPAQADGQPYLLRGFYRWTENYPLFTNLTLMAPAVLSGNQVDFAGILTLGSGVTVSIDSPVFNGMTARSNLTISGDGEILGWLLRAPSTQINIGPGVRVRCSIALQSGTLINQGLIQAAGTNAPINISGNGSAALTNFGTIDARDGRQVTVHDGVYWNSVGTISASTNGTVTLNGPYVSIGNIVTATGGQVIINGSPAPGATLTAPPGGMTINAPVNWDHVTLSGQFTFVGCGQAIVTNGLTLLPGTVISMESGACNYALQFNGAAQSVVGTGEIVSNNGGGRMNLTNDVTFGTGITLRTGSANLGAYIVAGKRLTSQGVLSISGAGRTLNLLLDGGGATQVLRNEGTFEVVNGATATLPLAAQNAGMLRIGPGSTVTVPSGASLTQTAQGTLRSIINGPNLLTNVGRLLVAGSYSAAGDVIVAYQLYNPPAICRPGVLIVEAQGAGASITGGFASSAVPPAPAPLLPRVRFSPPGIYFASTIVGDICALGGNLVPDGQITTDDLIAYLDVFFVGTLGLADVATLGGAIGPDGVLTADDIIVYLQSFFEECL